MRVLTRLGDHSTEHSTVKEVKTLSIEFDSVNASHEVSLAFVDTSNEKYICHHIDVATAQTLLNKVLTDGYVELYGNGELLEFTKVLAPYERCCSLW